MVCLNWRSLVALSSLSVLSFLLWACEGGSSSQFVEISSGETHTCALRDDGTVSCWGLNDFGQASPPEGKFFVTVASGSLHSCGITRDGSVSCWGSENLAAAYPAEEMFASIDVGFLSSCGIREDGVTFCWGEVYGHPEMLEGNYSSISNGPFFRCGLLVDGDPKCSGLGFDGNQLTQGDSVHGKLTYVSSGLAHVCAVNVEGSLFCWGNDESGQASPPQGKEFVSVSSGWIHTCSVRKDGRAICWGSDEFGQSSPPQEEEFSSISSGANHTCGLLTNGGIKCWGSDLHGQSSPHTDIAPRAEIEQSSVSLLWRVAFPVEDDLASAPVAKDGTVYVTQYDNSLYALEARTGQLKWSFKSGGWITASPVVVEGVVYAGSWDGFVYALKAGTGEQIWRHRTVGEVSEPLKVLGGFVYLVSDDQAFALNATSGELVWSQALDGHASFSPLLDGPVAYVGSLTGLLYALNASTGDVLWQHSASNESYSNSAEGGKVYDQTFSEPAVSNGIVYLVTDSGTVRALDSSNGRMLWEYPILPGVSHSPVLDGDAIYLAGLFEGPLYALDARTGELLWENEEVSGLLHRAASEGLVYASGHIGSRGHVYAVDGRTGEVRWRSPARRALDPFLANGTVYASYVDGTVERNVTGVSALDSETGETLWSYQTEVGLGQHLVVAENVVYLTPTENYLDGQLGYVGWYLYALAHP